MKTIAICLLALLTSLKALATNAAPLGLELGMATLAQVKQQLGSQTRLQDGGINAYSGGTIITGAGDGLGVDGLSEITLILTTPTNSLQC